MRPLVICIDCGQRTRNPGGRCRKCYLAHEKVRNAARKNLYGGTWRAESKARCKEQPWCSICGNPGDLTLDHDTNLVMCRHCNSSRRRNPE